MKFYVTYCITHPEQSPTTATGTVEARTRQELEVRLARGVGKWKKQGYAIEIVKVTCFEVWSEPILPDTGKVNFPALKCR